MKKLLFLTIFLSLGFIQIDETKFNDFNPNLSNSIGHELFYNSTRVQLKDLK
jgi:hypothetical protein